MIEKKKKEENDHSMEMKRLLNEVEEVVNDGEFNPFECSSAISLGRWIQLIVCSVTLAPFRLLVITVLVLLMSLLSHIGILGLSEEHLANVPISGWRLKVKNMVQKLAAGVVFFFGFHNVKINGELDVDTRIIVAASHSSFLDSFIFVLLNFPTAVSRQENQRVPLFGAVIRFIQAICVTRNDKNSRQYTIDEIKRRARQGNWRPVMLFPEGTCTNGKSIIGFKPGAFAPGMPVQPIAVRYQNEWNTTSWTWFGYNSIQIIWFSLCQFHINLEINILPLYYPSREEKLSPILYADNVRKVIAKKLKVPISGHSFEDCRLMNKAHHLKLPPECGLIGYVNIKASLKKFSFQFACRRLEAFAMIMHGVHVEDRLNYMKMISRSTHWNVGQLKKVPFRSNALTAEHFSCFFGFPHTQFMENYVKWLSGGSDYMTFRTFCIAPLEQCASNCSISQIYYVLTGCLKKRGENEMSNGFNELMTYLIKPKNSIDTSDLYEKISNEETKMICKYELKNCFQNYPEYLLLFMYIVKEIELDVTFEEIDGDDGDDNDDDEDDDSTSNLYLEEEFTSNIE
ncbi:hypothetical protein SNEBB_008692 [Seison nebaliae]|nr:hypothetical protein SNEBB_008692 [Seison nebaliae]